MLRGAAVREAWSSRGLSRGELFLIIIKVFKFLKVSLSLWEGD